MRSIWLGPVCLLAVGCSGAAEPADPEPVVIDPVVDAGGPCVQSAVAVGSPCTPTVTDAGALEPGPTTGAIAVTRAVAAGQSADQYAWQDADGRARTAAFVDDQFPGGYIRKLTYELADGSVREAAGGIDPSTGYQGFGYLVSHFDDGANAGSDSTDSRDSAAGHSETLWQGRHHVLRRYTVDLHPRLYRQAGSATIHATVHWLMATGRSDLVFSVTLDSSDAAASTVLADSRAPYGVIAWDGVQGTANVTGVSWGDKYRFTSNTASTGGFLTIASDWRYDEPNTIPFVQLSTASAEMGLVSTRTYALDVSGGDLGVWFDLAGAAHGSGKISARCWQKTSATAAGCADPASNGATAKMPATWMWPYQSVNYGLGTAPTRDKKLAWGSNYGAVGWGQNYSFDRQVTGYARTSYATHVVLGAPESVAAQRSAEEAVRMTALQGTRGTIAHSGPKGVADATTEPYAVPGYDPIYGVWRVAPDSSGVTAFSLTAQAPLVHPMFVVAGSAARVSLDGLVLRADVDYFASSRAGETWVTLNRDLDGAHTLRFE